MVAGSSAHKPNRTGKGTVIKTSMNEWLKPAVQARDGKADLYQKVKPASNKFLQSTMNVYETTIGTKTKLLR